ncbi:MAG TPA: glycosyltransferase family 4 protein [Mycobacteriales bacterium]|nr:glycosyltransferase family 4 protein [Mycobacteriales bacterium]
MRVGLVCPYTWDVPGGVQAHVRDLAECLIEMGHQVSVLAPVDEADEADLPAYLVPAGRTVPVPYNGSVARLCFGPVSLTRTRRWLRKGRFDVLHLHEPTVPSLSMLACFAARGSMVATFHTATARSRALQVFGTTLQPGLEKITGRIAVSPAARRVVVEHLGHDAVLVPNGVYVDRFAGAPPLDGLPAGPRLVFLGRIDEPRKGLSVLLEALPAIAARVPDVQLLVAGPGDVDDVRDDVDPRVTDRVHLLGLVSEADKPRVYASGDLYVAPNTHGESFGIVLIEAMATGTPVVASDLPAFRRVLDDGEAGALFPVGDAEALAASVVALLLDGERRRQLSVAASRVVQAYDWHHVARQVVEVYETVAAAAPVELDETADEPDVEDFGQEDDPGRVSEALRRWLAVVRERVAP